MRAAEVPAVHRDLTRRRAVGLDDLLFGFGITCLVAALGVAMYLVWLLWGTGFITSHAQHQLRSQLMPRIGTLPAEQGPAAGSVDARKIFLPGNAVAILKIPRIHLDMVAVEGTDAGSLTKGPGHYTDTAYPWQAHGRVAIAGHRTTYLHPFWSLDKMRPGDPIILATRYGTFRYSVFRVFTTSPGDLSVLDQTTTPTLALTTCDPRFSATRRLIVLANRKE